MLSFGGGASEAFALMCKKLSDIVAKKAPTKQAPVKSVALSTPDKRNTPKTKPVVKLQAKSNAAYGKKSLTKSDGHGKPVTKPLQEIALPKPKAKSVPKAKPEKATEKTKNQLLAKAEPIRAAMRAGRGSDKS